MHKITFFEAQKWAFSFSEQHGKAKEDVQFLLLGQMHWNLTHLLMNYQEIMPLDEWEIFQKNIKKCCEGYPPQYLLGYTNFFGLQLKVNADTLIPRPETEELVEWILTDCTQKRNLKIVDIGTGSGAIGLALKRQRPDFNITATDISTKALAVAQKNAQALNLMLNLKQSDLFSSLEEKYDIIVSNPPYIAYDEESFMDESVKKYEPQMALFADNHGLAIYQRLATEIKPYLKQNTRLYVEIGFKQGEAVLEIFKNKFKHATVTLKKDILGNDRMVRVKF
ncbi:peptide chain release factor N(5)-glutamine methyltransferase [Ligilactobacillus sp. WILCCON 0076]|uniref:Release factor glutamine methyltransferase n=1 Tax=Ligilactobacillus ubinensis TaxID=2876789 RepID=A0A9X2FGI8_9LACO|nr:peptide chain release factor N(5)-glutamine methyltransferase [Ligilactobacillus ubinensis]MCP0885964.1 peptide chain release factor N(5)-glutamine methyltransferase [Ligilactobacillus ubinensis]